MVGTRVGGRLEHRSRISDIVMMAEIGGDAIRIGML